MLIVDICWYVNHSHVQENGCFMTSLYCYTHMNSDSSPWCRFFAVQQRDLAHAVPVTLCQLRTSWTSHGYVLGVFVRSGRCGNIWVNCNDLITTSPKMMVSKVNYLKIALIQISENINIYPEISCKVVPHS